MSTTPKPTHDKILDAAIDLLTGGNAPEVRMGDVAKAAGISRQALYLHFKTRAELLIATTLRLDQIKGRDERLIAVRAAPTGEARLRLFVRGWGNYIPEIHGLARALMVMADTDAEAAEAWRERMSDLRDGCRAAVQAIQNDGRLAPDLTVETATDRIWMLLSLRNWEVLTRDCGWTQEFYLSQTEVMACQLVLVQQVRET